jgi:hypothetical protein
MSVMSKRPAWYDPKTEDSLLLAALDAARRYSCRSEEILKCARTPQGYRALEAIKRAIDDYAECEMGHREFFWDKPHSAGCKHT